MIMNRNYPELRSCHICPQNCGVDRYEARGFCGAATLLRVNSAHLHHGEEPVLSGSGGSGTIFLSHCNLRCVYCQNHEISHQGWGREISEEDCAKLMLKLQKAGAHNINLVSPSQYTPQLAVTIKLARAGGLKVPVVWNSNAHEKPETLKTLAGLVDIYMPDFKYAHSAYAWKYSQARDYPQVALQAIREMFSQVGVLTVSETGLAERGVLLRHLVLPNRLSGTRELLYRLHENFGPGISLSLMAQYYPAGESGAHPELARGLKPEEYSEAVELALDLGFTHVLTQELKPSPDWTPVFAAEPSAGPDDTITDFHGRNHHVR